MRDTVDGINEAAWEKAMMRSSFRGREQRAASFDREVAKAQATRHQFAAALIGKDVAYRADDGAEYAARVTGVSMGQATVRFRMQVGGPELTAYVEPQDVTSRLRVL